MKTWDAIIVGGGIIGLSLARELHKRGLRVLVLERGEPGREASHAAAGMLAYCDPEPRAALQALKLASAKLYPEFVRELEDESQSHVDFRREGTISFVADDEELAAGLARELTASEVAAMEPCIPPPACRAFYTPEESVDNRQLMTALRAAARHRDIEVAAGGAAARVELNAGAATGVATDRTSFAAPIVVNCAGAWAGSFGPVPLPVRPRKGQMLAVATKEHILRHVVRAPQAYIVPRSDGRILIGATVEDVGYDKRVDPDAIQRLHQAAANVVPSLGEARMLEAWAGLRPQPPMGCRFSARRRSQAILPLPRISATAFCWRRSRLNSWRRSFWASRPDMTWLNSHPGDSVERAPQFILNDSGGPDQWLLLLSPTLVRIKAVS